MMVGMDAAYGIRRRRLAAITATPPVAHPWGRDAAADLRLRLDNYRRSSAAAQNGEDRAFLLQCVALLERQIEALGLSASAAGL
jgi:hypothetical protein